MNMQIPQPMHVPLLIAGIAAILFSAVAMAIVPIIRSFHSSFEGFAQEQLTETSAAALSIVPSGTGKARVKARCEECGVVESMRRVAAVGNSPAIYEITVRMRDGSTRVSSDASPANWHPGERIILIGGGNQSGG